MRHASRVAVHTYIYGWYAHSQLNGDVKSHAFIVPGKNRDIFVNLQTKAKSAIVGPGVPQSHPVELRVDLLKQVSGTVD